MHIVVAFCVVLALFNSFFKETIPPPQELSIGSTETHAFNLTYDVEPLSEIKYRNIIKQKYDYSCGSAALSTLLNHSLGIHTDEGEVITGLIKFGDSELIAKKRAFSLYDMKQYLKTLGLHGDGYKANLSDLRGLRKSGIVAIEIFSYRHFVIFKGIHEGHVFVADPMLGNISFTEEQFYLSWYKDIIFVIDMDKKDPLNRLKINEDDLRFIDEDAKRHFIKNSLPKFDLKESELIMDQPKQTQFYYGN